MEQGSSSALLLMDFTPSTVQWHGEAGNAAVDRAAEALVAARSNSIPVFHVLPNYRPGYPELRKGQPFDNVIAAGLFRESPPAAGVETRLAPREHEAVVPKCRYSPFFANDLQHLLRMKNIRSLVLAGIATSGVVLSGVRDAWDLDYQLTVLEDACADPDPEVHRLLTTKIFLPQARVMSVWDWISSIRE